MATGLREVNVPHGIVMLCPIVSTGFPSKATAVLDTGLRFGSTRNENSKEALSTKVSCVRDGGRVGYEFLVFHEGRQTHSASLKNC